MQLTVQVDWLQVCQTSAVNASSTLRLCQQGHNGVEIDIWLSETDFIPLQPKLYNCSERDEDSSTEPWFDIEPWFDMDRWRLPPQEVSIFSFMGVGGVGKTNLIRLLQGRDQEHPYLAYDKLDHSSSQYRLLSLLPAKNKETNVYCTLAQVSSITDSKGPPVYEALSYTWGNPKREKTIYVNNSPFPITYNLHVALRSLRKQTESRMLWVDAICINQYNLYEKNHQVGMMRNIYYNAARVVVWLGISDPDIRKAMDLFKRVESGGLIFPKNEILGPYIRGIAKISNKPWWSRMWVVQEVLVAKQPPLLVCGRQCVSWDAFNIALSHLGWRNMIIRGDSRYSTLKLSFANLITQSSQLHSEHRTSSGTLEELLLATRDRQTTNPRDKVFALLGLTQDVSLHDFILDYEQPCSSVFQKAMFYVLDKSLN